MDLNLFERPYASLSKDLQTKMVSRRASAVFLVALGSFWAEGGSFVLKKYFQRFENATS